MAGAAVGNHHRPIGGFNPAWCLRRQARVRDAVTPISTSPPYTDDAGSTHLSRGSGDAAAAEPLSPRVGCMGQIKRDKAAGGGGKGTPVRIRLPTLRKFFSGWNAPGAAAACPRAAARARGVVRCGRGGGAAAAPRVCVAELDPPLPVLKREDGGGACPINLWTRRCGEELALECLQHLSEKPPPPLCVFEAALRPVCNFACSYLTVK